MIIGTVVTTVFAVKSGTHRITQGLAAPPEERAAHGFTDGLIRISVGLENCDDLRDDLIGSRDRLG